MNYKQKQIKKLLKEISDLYVDNYIELNKIPSENTDMEPYEGTEIEDLVNSAHISGQLYILMEIRELLISEL
jgi:hypothetical protein